MTTTPASTSTLSYPHPTLTPLRGKPTNTSLKLLRKEVYANARAIPSTRGGGNHGHLGHIMTVAQYAPIGAVAFTLPAHPGGAPVHGAAPTAFQIAETIRVYNADLEEIAIASRVAREIKQQILLAVDTRYITALEHEDFGFADVTIATIRHHEI